MGDLGRRLAAGLAGTATVKVANILLGIAVTVFLGRILGPSKFGLYSFAIVVVQFIGIPVNSGLRNLLIRETAKLQQLQDWAELNGLLRRAFELIVALSLLFICVGGALLLTLRGDLAEPSFFTYSIALFLFPLLGLLTSAGAVLIGLRHVIWGQLPDLALRPMLLVTILVGTYFVGLGSALGPSGAVAAAEVAAGIAVIVAIGLLFKYLPVEVRQTSPVYRDRAWLSSLLPFSLIAGIGIIQANTDILMLGAMKSHETVGLYRVASQGATLVAFALQAVNIAIAPHVARLYASGDMERLQRVLRLSVIAVVAFALPIFLVYLLWSGPLIVAIFGEVYRPAGTALVILSLGQLFSASMGSVGLLLNMTGHERDTVAGTILAAALNALLNLPLIIYFGMEGAAIATTLSLVAWNAFLARRAYRRVGIVTYLKLA